MHKRSTNGQNSVAQNLSSQRRWKQKTQNALRKALCVFVSITMVLSFSLGDVLTPAMADELIVVSPQEQPAQQGDTAAQQPQTADTAATQEAAAPEPTDESLAGVALSRSETGRLAVNAKGRAATDYAVMAAELTEQTTVLEAASIVRALAEVNPQTQVYDRSGDPTNSAFIDKAAEGLTVDDKAGDGSNIEDLQVKWVTRDSFEDGDEALLSVRPGTVGARTDAKQTVVAQIDYSVSGERDYEAGDLRIYVPATMFRDRNGNPAGSVVIPLAESPDRSTDFNWMLVDDYYVFTNTRPMSAATKGFIQIEWNNLTPHEIADGFASIYTDGDAKKYDEASSQTTGDNQTRPWFAYMEMTTNKGNTLKAASNEIKALMDTSEVVDAGYKRVQNGYPTRVAKDEIPADMIPAEYADESEFVVVEWYTYAHYLGNQPFSLDVADQLLADQDGAYEGGSLVTPLAEPGFIYKVTPTAGEATYDGGNATVEGIYSGWPQQERGNSTYVRVYSAYPFSQFEPNTEYIFHNQSTFTLNPVDGADTPTVVTATQGAKFSWHPSEWHDITGHFMVFKWGNDGEEELENYSERDMVAHHPSQTSRTISRMGTEQHYSTWKGIYEDAINLLRDYKEGDDPVRLWYTIKSEGWIVPWTIQQPTDESGVKPNPDLVAGWWQWAKWDDATEQYVVADEIDPDWAQYATYDKESNTYTTDTTKTDGYELIPYTRIQANYLQRPVTMVTTDQGLNLEGRTSTGADNNQSVSGGTPLTAGSDYTFDFVEVQKPRIGKLVGINVNMDGSWSAQHNQDGTFDYAEDDDVSKIPPVYFQIEVGGEWQQTDLEGADWYAKVDWSSGSPVTTYADGRTENSAVVKMPENTTNFRTVEKTKNAYLMVYLYPGVTLNPDGAAKLREFMAGKFTDSQGHTVYNPDTWIYNGVHMDAYQYDNSGTVINEANPVFQRTKWGEDELDGYTADVSVYPSKTAEFDHAKDVNYRERTATVHYTAKVEERTYITDMETYEKCVETGVITPEEGGVWYDLLPEGMVPDLDSVKLRDGDTPKRKYTVENWENTGRTMLIVVADLTPAPQTYKESQYDAVSYVEDVPTLTFDAKMDLDTWIDLGGNPADITTGITSHNVVAFESDNDFIGTVEDYSGEPDKIDQENAGNIATRDGEFSDKEKKAFNNVDKDRDTPSFVYAECTTNLAFPTAGRTSLSKNIMVNDDGRWSQGTYDDKRTVLEGGYYSYRLRMASDSGTKSKNLVMYDTLENYQAVDGNDPADIDAPRWRGHLMSVDVSQLESMGCAPVVYYSTEENLLLTDPDNARRSNAENCDIDNNTDVWVLASEYTGDLADVHAIAIDCRKTADGGDFILEADQSMTAYIRMHAPSGTKQWDDYEGVTKYYEDTDAKGSARDYIAADAHAYNNVYLVSTSVSADDEFPDEASTLDFIRFDYTKVGLEEYKIPVTKLWDDDNDRDGKRPDKVVATLYANGEPAGEDIIVDNKVELVEDEEGNWTGEFRNIPYTDGNGERITYSITETVDDVPADYVASSTGSEGTGFTITNKHAPELTSVSGTKSWENDTEDVRPAYIDVQLYIKDKIGEGKDRLVSTKRVTPTVEVVQEATDTAPAVTRQVWPTFTFDDLYKYEDGEEIEYYVKEVVPDGAYVSAISDNDITNTYHPYGDVSITKKVSGATEAVANKEYEFEVVLETPAGDGEFAPLSGSYEWESSTGATGTVESGGKLMLKGDETVTIKELPHQTKVTFTESEYPGFTTSGGGVKSTTVQQNRTRTVNVNNTYTIDGSVNMTAFKELAGTQLKNNKFLFKMVDNETGKTLSAANRADGGVTFGAIKFGNADDGKTFTYTITEIVPDEAENADGVTWAEATDEQKAAGGFKYKGYVYDSSTYYIATVTVKDNEGKGKFDVELVYTDKDGNVVDEAAFRSFKNAYEAKGETSMTAWKVLDDGGIGRALEDEEFTFELVPDHGEDAEGNEIDAADIPMPVDGEGNALNPDTATNDADGVIHFDTIKYTQEDVGNTYYYLAREVPGDDPDIVYSTQTFAYKVTVADNGDGTLSVVQGNVEAYLEDAGPLTWDDADSAQKEAFTWVYKPGGNQVYIYTGDADGSVLSSKDSAAEWLSRVLGVSFDAGDIRIWLPSSGDFHLTDEAWQKVVAQYTQFADGYTTQVSFIYPVGKPGSGLPTTTDYFTPSRAKNTFALVKNYRTVVTPDPTDELPVFVNELKNGGLSIEKAIQGDGADPSQEFTFHVKLTGEKVNPDGVYEYDLQQVEGSSASGNDASNLSGQSEQTQPDPLQSLANLLAPEKAYAAPAEGAELVDSGSISSTVEWRFYSDGTLVIAATNGVEGTWSRTATYGIGYNAYRHEIKHIETEGIIHQRGLMDLCNYFDVLETADLSGFETSGVTSIYQMFYNCPKLREVTGLSGFENTTRMDAVFYNCSSLTDVDLSNISTASATTMSQMFSGCSALTEIDTSGFDTSNVTSMSSMFSGCKALTDLDVSGFDTSNVTNMSYMFSNCSSLTELDVSKWNTSGVTNMSYMFNNCSSLTELDVSNFDTSNVTNMTYMFNGCSSLTELDVSNFNTSNVTSMSYMFCDCRALEEIDVSSWDTSKVTSMMSMFFTCRSLKELDCSNFDTAVCTSFWWFVTSCTSLEKLDLSGLDMSNASSYLLGFDYSKVLQELRVNDKLKLYTDYYTYDVPTTPQSPLYTGKWIRVNNEGAYYGESMTGTEWKAAYIDNPESMVGTWVWEKANHILHFDANGGEGAMDDYSITETVFTLPQNQFTNDMGEFAGWSVDGPKAFDDGDQVRLYASSSTKHHITKVGGGGQGWPGRGMSLDGVTFETTLKALWNYTKYKVSYQLDEDDAAAGASGSMGSEVVVADDEHKLADPKFYWFKHVVTGWDVSVVDQYGKTVTRGKTHYGLGETVDPNVFKGGDRVTLTATWGDQDTTAQSHNGEFTIKLHGGERAVFDDIPAGTAYEVWEDTPDGWVLVKSVDENGVVQPNEISAASFLNEATEKQVAKQKLHATKLLQTAGEDGGEATNEEISNGQFKFELYEGESAEGEPLQTVTNGVGADDPTVGTVEFRELSYTEKGTYTYTIKEVAGDDKGVEYDSKTVKATVEVVEEDDGEGGTKLVAKDPVYDPANATFVNNTVEETTYNLTIEKAIEDAPETVPTFTFDVTLTDGKGIPLAAGTEVEKTVDGQATTETLTAGGKLTVTIEGEGSVQLGKLPEGTKFTVAETNLPAGWTLTTPESVQGELTADQKASFTNKYTTTGLVSLKANKELAGGTFEEGDFTFALYSDAECTNQLQAKSNGPVTDGVAAVTFDPVELEGADTYTYYIKELAGDDPTIEYDTETVVVATVVATDNGNGSLSTEVSYEGGFDTITNTKKGGSLAITKKLENAGPNLASVEFTVTAEFTDAAGTPLEGEFAWESSNGATGTVASGGTLTIKGDETITINGLPDGSRYVVAEDEDAAAAVDFELVDSVNVEGTIVSTETQEATFTNSYITGVSTTLKATKKLEGGTLEKDMFTFQLLDADGNVIDEAKNDAKGNIAFGELAFAASDAGKEFTYSIKEVEGDASYIGYDLNTYKATVKVSRNDAGEMVADVTYADAQGQSVESVEFVNTYEANGSGKVEVSKVLNGADLTDGQFTFTLKQPNGYPLSSIDNRDKITATNDGDGKVVFSSIAYGQDDAGKTFTYVVTEDEPKDPEPGMTYDPHACTVTMKVTDNGDGSVTATPTYSANGDVFTNTKSAPAKGSVSVEKKIDGRNWRDGDKFTFTITADKYNPDPEALPLNANGNPVTKVDVTEAGAKSFGEITFNKVGSYQYTVTEVKGELGGITYNAEPQTVTIVVVDDGNGHLVARDDSNLEPVVTVTNGYDASGSTSFTGTKSITGRGFKPGDSAVFTIEQVTEGAPMPENPSVTVEVGEGSSVDFEFEAINYALANIPEGQESATFEYKVVESACAMPGVKSPDSTVYTVNVTISDNGDGTLKVDKAVTPAVAEGETDVTFTNTYEATGKASFEAQKTLEGRALVEDEFTFELVDADKGEVLQTVKNDADGKVTFEDVVYSVADVGTHNYKIREVAGEAGGVTYDTNVLEVAVQVTDNFDGTLKVTYNEKEALGDLKFVNRYDAAGTVEFSGTKSIEGREFESGDSATFKVEALTEGAPMPAQDTVTVTPTKGTSADFKFGAISYKLSDIPEGKTSATFEYKVTESAYTMRGVTAADATPYTVSVTISDKGDGTLDVKASDNATALKFVNKAEGTSIPVKKTWSDSDNANKARPKSVTIHLLANGKDTGKSVKLSDSNSWKASFDDLPAKGDDGKAIEYTVKEDAVTNYTAKVTGSAEKGYTVTNTYTTKKTNKSTSSTPRTGDGIGLFAGLFAALAGAAAIALFMAWRRRRA